MPQRRDHKTVKNEISKATTSQPKATTSVRAAYGDTTGGTADALARVQEQFKADPAYAKTLGISKRGMDFVRGAEAALRATGACGQEA